MSSSQSPEGGRRNRSVALLEQHQPQQTPRHSQPGIRPITVDNVLQYTSDVPSMQQRRPQQRPQMRARSRLSAAGGLSAATGVVGVGGPIGAAGRLAAQPRLAPRTTRVSEKLVLLPETIEEAEEEAYPSDELVQRLAQERNEDPETLRRQLSEQQRHPSDFHVDNNIAPLLAEEEALRRRRVPMGTAKSYAERLPKARRADKLPRVTAYCTAKGYKIGPTTSFIREWHGARTKLYDDCLYVAYQLPLLPGDGGYRIRSSPILKGIGGKVVLDEEIERNERRDHHEEYFREEHFVSGSPPARSLAKERNDGESRGDQSPVKHERPENGQDERSIAGVAFNSLNDPLENWFTYRASRHISPGIFSIAEMFVFSYGVVVFWNFTERQEKDILADLTFSSSGTTTAASTAAAADAPVSLATQPLSEEDFETEEFHFEYSTEIPRPRVYNDMITLRSGDHMIKLAISHGIAQSTKLCFFEEAMAKQMIGAKDIPRRLAVTGKLGLKREDVFRILGGLFRSRVEVNLSSNVLDVPNFFWESEPTLYPLYIAVREYLEIKPRIQVLNERCRVFLDLTEILSDSIADNNMSHQTWIIIALICISIIITISEVFLRFGLLSTRGHPSPSLSFLSSPPPTCNCPGFSNVNPSASPSNGDVLAQSIMGMRAGYY